MPPSRGPSSFHGVRVGSLNSFNGPSPGAIRYGSNFSVPGLVPGYPEYGGMLGRVYRGQEERGFDSQYESASIYQATHPTLNTANREGKYIKFTKLNERISLQIWKGRVRNPHLSKRRKLFLKINNNKKYGLKYTCLGVHKYTCLGVHKLWSSQGGLIKGLGVTTL